MQTVSLGRVNRVVSVGACAAAYAIHCASAHAQQPPVLMPALTAPAAGERHINIQIFLDNATGAVKDVKLHVNGGNPGGSDCDKNAPETTCDGLIGYTAGTRQNFAVSTTYKSTCVTIVWGGGAKSYCK